MKKIICITISLIIALIPCFSFASMQYTNYDNIFYDNEYNGFFDTNSGDYMDLSFLPEDLIISDDIAFDGVVIDESTPDEWTNSFSPEEEINLISDEDAACTVNGVNYSSLQNVFDELPSDKTLTIELCTDAYAQTALLVPSGYHITILLNSNDIISEANYAFISDGDLTIIGAGTILNSLGGGIYNRGIGLVRLQACAEINSKGTCLVNNADGSIYYNSDCTLVTAAQNETVQLNAGAGSINNNKLFGEEEETQQPMLLRSPMMLGSILPQTENISFFNDKIWIGDFGSNLIIADSKPTVSFEEHTFAEIVANPYIYFDDGSYFELGAGIKLGLAYFPASSASSANQHLTWAVYDPKTNTYWRAGVTGLRFNAFGKYSELNIEPSPTIYVGDMTFENFIDSPTNNCRTLFFKLSDLHTSINSANQTSDLNLVAVTGILSSNTLSCSQTSNLVPRSGYRLRDDAAINIGSSYFLSSKCTYNDITFLDHIDSNTPYVADLEYEETKSVSIPYSELYAVNNENQLDFIVKYGLQLTDSICVFPKVISTSGNYKYLAMAFYNAENNATYTNSHNSTNYNNYEYRLSTDTYPYSAQTGNLDITYKASLYLGRFVYVETTISNVYKETTASASVGVLRSALASTDETYYTTYADTVNHFDIFASSYIGASKPYTSVLFTNQFTLKEYDKLIDESGGGTIDPDGPHHDLDREGLDGIFNAGLEILQKVADVILEPPYVYILGFVLLVLIAVILKRLFSKW